MRHSIAGWPWMPMGALPDRSPIGRPHPRRISRSMLRNEAWWSRTEARCDLEFVILHSQTAHDRPSVGQHKRREEAPRYVFYPPSRPVEAARLGRLAPESCEPTLRERGSNGYL